MTIFTPGLEKGPKILKSAKVGNETFQSYKQHLVVMIYEEITVHAYT